MLEVDMNTKVLTIDGNRFESLSGFYDEVERVMTKDLGWSIGRNLDAFNDVMRGGFGAFEYGEHIELIWEHSDKSKTDLGYPETVKYLKHQLTNCHSGFIPQVTRELEHAQNGVGPTLLDIIVEIVHYHDNIDLRLK